MKIAFAGAGYIINIHAKAAQAQPDMELAALVEKFSDKSCLLYTSPSPRDRQKSRMPSSA